MYKVRFRTIGALVDHEFETDRAIVDFKDGFWINNNLQPSFYGSDAKYWIPPNAIVFIEKITK